MRSALITGITGQDGAYLSELLLEKGYSVFGIQRRTSYDNTIILKEHLGSKFNKIKLLYGDITDSPSITRIISEIKPDEIYNLAAQSHVGISFDQPEYANSCNAMGIVRILESVRILGLINKTRIYQASTSELFGSSPPPQSEETIFHPMSPYAISKLFAYWAVRNYREAYNAFACNGILFNHESPLRGKEFVSRKITYGLANVMKNGGYIYLGNLDAERDWGHARDYVRAMWLMLQSEYPDDYIIATGEKYTVREFVETAVNVLGKSLEWKGSGLNEQGLIDGKVVFKIDKSLFRPAEVISLQGNAEKARKILDWKPEINFNNLVSEMVKSDLHEFSDINGRV